MKICNVFFYVLKVETVTHSTITEVHIYKVIK
jgi:hypothetical protein